MVSLVVVVSGMGIRGVTRAAPGDEEVPVHPSDRGGANDDHDDVSDTHAADAACAEYPSASTASTILSGDVCEGS